MDKTWKFHRVLDATFPEEGTVPYLDDCSAEDLRVEDGKLIFDFPDGFWLLPWDERNPFDEVHRSSASRVTMELSTHSPEDDLFIQLFKRHRFFRGCGFETVTCIDANTLIENIHGKKWRLEFIERYTNPINPRTAMYYCAIRSKKYMECWIKMDYTQIDYYWDEVLEDRVW